MTQPLLTRSPALRAFATLVLLALLAVACAPPEPPGPSQAEIDELSERAERSVAADQPLAAVRTLADLVDMTEGEEAQRWRLAIVEILFDHGYPELGLEHHARLDAEPVPEPLRLRKRVVDAQAAAARRQSIRALSLLPAIDPSMPPEVRARIHATRADAYALTGQAQRAIAERMQREPLLDRDSMINANQEQIWVQLETLSEEDLETMRTDARTRTERGWADLALRMREVRMGRATMDRELATWERQHRDHPAIGHFGDLLRDRMIAEMTLPERIDVLLPLSGSLADAASAVRNGMLAAYFSTPEYIDRPQIVFHDVGEDGEPVETAYRNAVDQGARFVIGPLDRDTVAEFGQRDEFPVPVLSLNYTDGNTAADFYQFGLRPEDEARQVAAGAIENDRFNAVALVPGNQWGDRMLASFQERFEELGGVLLESAEYNPRDTDYGTAIQRVLNLDDSHARHRLLQSTLGSSVGFEPRRRDDAEVVFLAAMPRQGRLAKPQLDFHRIGTTPIYSTSHIYSGQFDPDSDWDLNGLYFTETPWILNQIDDTPDPVQEAIMEQWPDAARRSPRLFALGTDAYELIAHLSQLEQSRDYHHEGRTGRLSMNRDRQLQRELNWARFERGVPTVVRTPATELELDIPLGTDILRRSEEP